MLLKVLLLVRAPGVTVVVDGGVVRLRVQDRLKGDGRLDCFLGGLNVVVGTKALVAVFMELLCYLPGLVEASCVSGIVGSCLCHPFVVRVCGIAAA